MRRVLVLLPLLVLFCACKTTSSSHRGGPVKLSAEERTLIGVWEDDSGGAVTTIRESDDGIAVVSVIDSDGEVFPIQHFDFKDGVFTWTFSVPSTGYVVRSETTQITQDVVYVSWMNQHTAGPDVMRRIGP